MSEVQQFRAEIFDEPKGDERFAVMFLPVPGFPDDSEVDGIVRPVMKAVIAARKGFETDSGAWQDGWSFVHLESEEKHCIGDALVEAGVPDHVWKWCDLYIMNKGPNF